MNTYVTESLYLLYMIWTLSVMDYRQKNLTFYFVHKTDTNFPLTPNGI